ncbi:SMI1/KNR4 family protein [Methylocaldum marinum]|uniref:SMI1/KNR4 family protein n=1 Tax=Methylocaldum marinum TaxID=1432792 RepID=UPI001472841C|nr:SMI1/KNR4 family protein [Methylocaldum marinum]
MRILLPPQSPVDVPSNDDWRLVEQKFGGVPADFRWFVDCYGSGRIDNFLFTFNPASRNPHLNLFTQVDLQLDALRELRSGRTEVVPYSLFPEPHGLLPFALTDNGDVLYWITEGSPNQWRVAINDSREPEWEEYSWTLSELLVRLLTKKARSSIFPKDFPSERPSFEPSLR